MTELNNSVGFQKNSWSCTRIDDLEDRTFVIILGIHWKDWCWSWNSDTLATSCEELTYWKRPWCWEGLGAGGEGDEREWDGWMASLIQWTWVWVNSGSWWWTGRPGVLRFMGSQRVGQDWVTELNWTKSGAKRMKKNEEILWELQVKNNVCIYGNSEEKGEGTEIIFKAILAENFSDLRRERDIQINRAQKFPNCLGSNRATERHNIIKFSKDQK